MAQKTLTRLLTRLVRRFPIRSATKPSGTRQAPVDSAGVRPIQLVIGLDFGTSFSKVVVGETTKRYAVPFEDYSVGDNPLLLPSCLRVKSGDGECTLGINGQGGVLHDNLKMPLIEGDFSDEVRARAAAFLALVLRHTRDWLFKEHGKTYRNRKIEWFVNVGLPTDSYDVEELNTAYLDIVRSAWFASILPGAVTYPAVLEIVKQNVVQLDEMESEVLEQLLPDDRINAFPEFSAQITGYVRSPSSQEGLHATADVGGGTLDVTIFNVLQRDGEPRYPIFFRWVKPLGVRYLMSHRLKTFGKEDGNAYSPFENMPSHMDFINKYEISEGELEDADRPFRRRVQDEIVSSLKYTREHRDPKAAHWDPGSSSYGDGLKSFFCGGGVLSEFYSGLLHEFEAKPATLKLRPLQLPVPEDLEMPGDFATAYARLAVAYGLSFDPFDIGKIKRESEIEDIPIEMPESRLGDSYVAKEHT